VASTYDKLRSSPLRQKSTEKEMVPERDTDISKAYTKRIKQTAQERMQKLAADTEILRQRLEVVKNELTQIKDSNQ
jgi:hypothetical protein